MRTNHSVCYSTVPIDVMCENSCVFCLVFGIDVNTGASGMHVSGAWHKEGSMKYGNNAGTYSSFPADLRHRSVKLGHQAGILKIAFFFTIIRNKPKATPKTKTKTTSKLGVRRSTRVFKS